MVCIMKALEKQRFILFDPPKEIGRTAWLMDYVDDNQIGTQARVVLGDVVLSCYILGTNFTPYIGVCDLDKWREFKDKVIPQNLNANEFEHLIPKSFTGIIRLKKTKWMLSTIMLHQWVNRENKPHALG